MRDDDDVVGVVECKRLIECDYWCDSDNDEWSNEYLYAK